MGIPRGRELRRFGVLRALALAGTLCGCATYSPPSVKHFEFPKDRAFFDEPSGREFDKLGLVRTKVDYNSLHPEYDESQLCQNAFNQAARDLVERARDAGGDAVMGVRSVVMLMSGQMETHRTAECADDGSTGQVLAQGIVIRWKDSTNPKRAKKLKEPTALVPQASAEGESKGTATSGASKPARRVIRANDPVLVDD